MNNESNQNIDKWIKHALKLAEKAKNLDEVPVGAVIVRENQIISSAFNMKEQNQISSHHAEILAIESACKKLGTWRLTNCQMYVSLEPCLMCAGAIIQARISEVFFSAYDPKGGALGSLYQVHKDKRLNHQFNSTGGICSEESSKLLKTKGD